MSPSDKPVAQLQRRLARLRLYPSINTRIIGPFLIVVLIVASIGMFLVTRLVAGSLQERLTNQLVDSANAASSSLVDIESQQLATLRLLTLTEGVPNAIATSNKADLERWLQPIAVNGRVDSVIVFDQAGNSLLHIRRAADSDPSHSGQYQSIDAPFLNNWSGVQKVLQAQADALGDKFVDIIGQAADSPVTLERLIVMRVPTPELLNTIQTTPALRRYLSVPLGTTAVAVREDQWADLAAALQSQGILVDVLIDAES